MTFQRIASTFTASILVLGSVLGSNFASINPAKADSQYRFKCQKSGSVWKTIAQTPRGDRDIIPWTSDFGGSAGYTPEKRCMEVSNRLDKYVIESNPFYMTHGKQKGYPVICRTTFEGGGCDGLIYTLDPKSGSKPDEVVKSFLSLAGNDFSGPSLPDATSCPLYVNVRSLLQSRQNSRGNSRSARYVCRRR
jgi:hypothetical protein